MKPILKGCRSCFYLDALWCTGKVAQKIWDTCVVPSSFNNTLALSVMIEFQIGCFRSFSFFDMRRTIINAGEMVDLQIQLSASTWTKTHRVGISVKVFTSKYATERENKKALFLCTQVFSSPYVACCCCCCWFFENVSCWYYRFAMKRYYGTICIEMWWSWLRGVFYISRYRVRRNI